MDAVIVWEAPGDPEYKLKKAKFLSGVPERNLRPLQKKPARNPDSLTFCLASILKNALFIRRIFIISPLREVRPAGIVEEIFPDSMVEIHIINREKLYKSRPGYLPVYNPDTLGLMAPMISGLGDNFLFLGPDTLFTAPCSIEDFLKKGRTVVHDSEKRRVPPLFLRRFAPRPERERIVAVNSARVAGSSYYCTPSPAPVLIDKGTCLRFYEKNKDLVEPYFAKRIKTDEDISLPSLYCSLSVNKDLIFNSKKETLILKGEDDGTIIPELRILRQTPDLRFCKLPDLYNLSFYSRHAVTDWISEKLELRI